MNHYRAFGLNIASEIDCPVLLQRLVAEACDVLICRGSVPAQPLADEAQLSFDIKGVARYWIQHGKTITVDYADDVDFDALWLYLLGSAMGAVLHQRGFLVLHGNAIVVTPQAAVVFVGPSGIGKSTLAEGFRQQGYALLTDDVSAVYFDEKQQPWVVPGYPALKLWQESADHFNHDTSALKPISNRETKFHVPFINEYCPQPVPLKAVVELVLDFPSGVPQKLTGAAGFAMINDNIYRPQYVSKLKRQSAHFQQCVTLCKHTALYRITRPQWPLTAELLTQLMQAILVD